MERKRAPDSSSSTGGKQAPAAKKARAQSYNESGGYVVMKKRTDYLQWDEYFMAVAFLSAERSKDPKSQVVGSIKMPTISHSLRT